MDDDKPLVPSPTPPSPDSGAAWLNHLANLWNTTQSGLHRLLPLDKLAQGLVRGFTVNEDQIAEILAQVRAELPTTEIILIGKPQAGKSSIIRGLTGVSAAIVGQGFRPHTQNIQRYAYPSPDLPLFLFTDTVGLGEANHTTEALLADLEATLQTGGEPARVLVLTLKITDFATDSLHYILSTLRQKYPQIPCLLAVTCLHEVYPSRATEHPAYPPDFPEVQRAWTAIQSSFAPLWDQAVLLDFTLEEDGYEPTFYGLAALRETLASLLPEAEARTIHHLLDGETGKRLGSVYRDVARRYILTFALMAGTLAAIPLPFATMPVLTALQVSLVGLLGQLYGQVLSPSQAGGVVSAIAGGFLAQAVGRELIKFVPGFGTAIAASWAMAYTWSLGEGACVYFGDLMGGKKPDPQKIQNVMKEAFQTAQERFRDPQSKS
ncbi:50S ribosome-binding GTPase [Synechocystis sp. LKSZ1]|uniref:YcjF family protein n=1 Tax=Synechocystis sp. LKSZ1 TaxID=3144951 RepID=UPI00336BD7DA